MVCLLPRSHLPQGPRWWKIETAEEHDEDNHWRRADFPRGSVTRLSYTVDGRKVRLHIERQSRVSLSCTGSICCGTSEYVSLLYFSRTWNRNIVCHWFIFLSTEYSSTMLLFFQLDICIHQYCTTCEVLERPSVQANNIEPSLLYLAPASCESNSLFPTGHLHTPILHDILGYSFFSICIAAPRIINRVAENLVCLAIHGKSTRKQHWPIVGRVVLGAVAKRLSNSTRIPISGSANTPRGFSGQSWRHTRILSVPF